MGTSEFDEVAKLHLTASESVVSAVLINDSLRLIRSAFSETGGSDGSGGPPAVAAATAFPAVAASGIELSDLWWPAEAQPASTDASSGKSSSCLSGAILIPDMLAAANIENAGNPGSGRYANALVCSCTCGESQKVRFNTVGQSSTRG